MIEQIVVTYRGENGILLDIWYYPWELDLERVFIPTVMK